MAYLKLWKYLQNYCIKQTASAGYSISLFTIFKFPNIEEDSSHNFLKEKF